MSYPGYREVKMYEDRLMVFWTDGPWRDYATIADMAEFTEAWGPHDGIVVIDQDPISGDWAVGLEVVFDNPEIEVL